MSGRESHRSPAPHSPELKLEELASLSGVPARTIRLYITRGLLPRPLRSGPGAAYGPQHLAALEQIRRLQAKGLTLIEIAQQIGSPGEPATPPSSLPSPVSWLTFTLSDDVVVQVRADAHPWRLSKLRRLLAEMRQQMSDAADPSPPSLGSDSEGDAE